MRINNQKILIAASISAMILSSGCTSLKRAAGVEKVVPDEFRVVTKAPLVVPPEFNLRPPRPGEARPLELRADLQARNAVFGVQTGSEASLGEIALIKSLGAQNADPRIRDVIDDENGNLTHKPTNFVSSIISFEKPKDSANPLNSTEEADRLKAEREAINNSTGGGKVKIQQNKPRAIKLPGL